ncbi:ubiquinone biosynthesis hydroxylase [Salinarimonas soli]|uniref:Ubiquinone biosynthesis hydroxylase n=1 Tax=Salinarimonas soli TaxID=1638099 RepID=A0A5B2V5H1_9HYPH|nr:ubiquinone biosynthesis hydroxylase [Salinarimonas soli]KAA2233419.1 ubiquinone biosynthesis hydroxylase [Salinarimonas soli]
MSNPTDAAPRPEPWTVAIAGGGIAGLSLALALKSALPDAVDVILFDPALSRDPRGDRRAYAVAAAARRMFTALGVWEAVSGGEQPILDMVVTDSRLGDVVRPVFLTFEGDAGTGEPFAHMVESGALVATLLDACRAAGVRLETGSVRGYQADGPCVRVDAGDGAPIKAHLLVAADGGRSRLRGEAGIGWVGWSYPQSGIVATIGHERDHEGRAVEHFLPSGPFAILPLAPGGALGHRSSIVWTERNEVVPHMLALSPEDALAEIERRFGLQLGRLALETPLRAYPLSFGIARDFVAPRLALLGDAAHVIHPIAGQGLNLGLKDVASLAEAVVDAARLGMDPGGADVLETYQRARRFDTLAMGVVTDGLNRLFSNDATPIRLVRDLGLGLVDRLPVLKRFFIREAAGMSPSTPRLMRGEVL